MAGVIVCGLGGYVVTRWSKPDSLYAQVSGKWPHYAKWQDEVISRRALWNVSEAKGSFRFSHNVVPRKEVTHSDEKGDAEHLATPAQFLPWQAHSVALQPSRFGLLGQHGVGASTFGQFSQRGAFGIHTSFFDCPLTGRARVIVDDGYSHGAAFGNHFANVGNNSLKIKAIPFLFKVYFTQSCFNLKPRSLRLKSDIIGFDHSFGGLLRFASHFDGHFEGSTNKPQSPKGEPGSDRAYYEHPKSPERHIPLGIQILLGCVSIAGGAALFFKAFRQQDAFSTEADSLLVPLSFFLIVIGALVAIP
jgi:hypothetical protein